MLQLKFFHDPWTKLVQMPNNPIVHGTSSEIEGECKQQSHLNHVVQLIFFSGTKRAAEDEVQRHGLFGRYMAGPGSSWLQTYFTRSRGVCCQPLLCNKLYYYLVRFASRLLSIAHIAHFIPFVRLHIDRIYCTTCLRRKIFFLCFKFMFYYDIIKQKFFEKVKVEEFFEQFLKIFCFFI